MIEKQEAIEAIEVYRKNIEHILGNENELVKVIETCRKLVDEIEEVPETHYTDTISRRGLLKYLEEKSGMNTPDWLRETIEEMPDAQPEIIRCGNCKYAEVADGKDSQDGYTCQFHKGSIWFSGSYCSWAERRTNG